LGGRDRARNSRIAWNQVAGGRVGELGGLHSRNRRGEATEVVAPRPGNVPAQTEVQGQVVFDLPGICDEQRSITGAVVKKLDGALHEIGGSADVVVGNISTCFISGELEVSVGSAFVARIQLIVPVITAKAERMVAHGLAERVA